MLGEARTAEDERHPRAHGHRAPQEAAHLLHFEARLPDGLTGVTRGMAVAADAWPERLLDASRTPLAATAWQHYIGCPKVTPAVFGALRDFRKAYTDKAPERIP